jgi:hypothetical protein
VKWCLRVLSSCLHSPRTFEASRSTLCSSTGAHTTDAYGDYSTAPQQFPATSWLCSLFTSLHKRIPPFIPRSTSQDFISLHCRWTMDASISVIVQIAHFTFSCADEVTGPNAWGHGMTVVISVEATEYSVCEVWPVARVGQHHDCLVKAISCEGLSSSIIVDSGSFLTRFTHYRHSEALMSTNASHKPFPTMDCSEMKAITTLCSP